MCGIAGLKIRSDFSPDIAVLKQHIATMTATLAARGPDASGHKVIPPI